MKDARFYIACLLIFVTLFASVFGVYMIGSDLLSVRESENAMQDEVEDFRKYLALRDSSPNRNPSSEETVPIEENLHEDLYKFMEEYNIDLFNTKQAALMDSESFITQVVKLADYGIEDGVVGIVSIPAIDVELPLYLSATGQNMNKGFAQLSHTSMPIGGANTNSVLACHRGFHGAAYLRDVEQMKIGDEVIIENLWEKLTYKVTGYKIIEPDDMSNIMICPGKDMITLLTCHPFNVSTHRYLVFCERYYPEDETDVIVATESTVLPNNEGVAENIETPDGYEFESSQKEILIERYVSYFCLAAIVVVCLITVTSLAVFIRRNFI